MSRAVSGLLAAAGRSGGPVYVEDVFSAFLYAGDGGSGASIANGIDFSGEGGMLWLKDRSFASHPRIFDTISGVNESLFTSLTSALTTTANSITAFNEDGFDYGSSAAVNAASTNYVTWSFRKRRGFFDLITWTGDGTTGREIPHGLGSTPGAIFVKRLDSADDWFVFHKSQAAGKVTYLNRTDVEATIAAFGTQTAENLVVGSNSGYINSASAEYVAYLFADDDQSFGLDSDESIIKCGSTGGTITDLGWEPQWILHKGLGFSSDWQVIDAARGHKWKVDGQALSVNSSAAETTDAKDYAISADRVELGAISGTHLYIAIRRPMKTPENVSEVFSIATEDASEPTYEGTTFVDVALYRNSVALYTQDNWLAARNWRQMRLKLQDTSQGGAEANAVYNFMAGWGNTGGGPNSDNMSWMFTRRRGFCDIQFYSGNGSARTLPHELGVVPELMFVKSIGGTYSRAVAVYIGPLSGPTNDYVGYLDGSLAASDSPLFNDTAPTDSVFSVSTDAHVNGSGSKYLNLMFASLAGISDIGTYSGTGADVTVDCGFASGAAAVLIKRTDSAGDWFFWDSVRGIVAGNDPYFLLNSTAVGVTATDYIDPDSSGFVVTSGAPAALNASGGTYLYLAIAA